MYHNVFSYPKQYSRVHSWPASAVSLVIRGTSKAHSEAVQYLGTCPLPLPTAPETPWALNLPSQQSLGTCLEPLPPRQLLQLLQHGPQPPLGTCLQPLPPRPLLLLLHQEYKAPNLDRKKACGVSQSVAPVILPSPRPRGLRPHKTGSKSPPP